MVVHNTVVRAVMKVDRKHQILFSPLKPLVQSTWNLQHLDSLTLSLVTSVIAVQVMKQNCSYVIAVGALLCRRTVGILYVLASCFSQVRYAAIHIHTHTWFLDQELISSRLVCCCCCSSGYITIMIFAILMSSVYDCINYLLELVFSDIEFW